LATSLIRKGLKPRSGTSRRLRKAMRSFDSVETRIDRRKHNKSRITNGRKLLPLVDGRSVLARRFRDIAGGIIADHGDDIPEAQRQLIRRFAAASVIAEQMEAKLASGGQIDINQHALLCSTLVLVGKRLGLQRRVRDVTRLSRYLDEVEGVKLIEATS
jgi:hypothetical protein